MRVQGFVLRKNIFVSEDSPSHGSWKDKHPIYNRCREELKEVFIKTRAFIFLHTMYSVLLILCVASLKT